MQRSLRKQSVHGLWITSSPTRWVGRIGISCSKSKNLNPSKKESKNLKMFVSQKYQKKTTLQVVIGI